MNTIRAAVLVALAVGAACNDLRVGGTHGNIVYNETVQASPTIWRQSQQVAVNVSDHDVITGVVITDNRENKDGEATIIEGGEGQQNVTIELKSPAVFRGFDFHVVVYAAGKNLPVNFGQHPAVLPNGEDQQQIDVQHPFPTNGDDQQQTDVQHSFPTSGDAQQQTDVQHSFPTSGDDQQQTDVQHSFPTSGDNQQQTDVQHSFPTSGDDQQQIDVQHPAILPKDDDQQQINVQHPVVLSKDDDQQQINVQHPAILTNDNGQQQTDVQLSLDPLKDTQNKGTTPPTENLLRKSRNTQQPDAVVTFVTQKAVSDADLSTTKVPTTNVPSTTEKSTDKAVKTRGAIVPVTLPRLDLTTEANQLKVNKDFPDVKDLDVHTTKVAVTSTTEKTHEDMSMQNFDSISKELGQKVVFGIKKH